MKEFKDWDSGRIIAKTNSESGFCILSEGTAQGRPDIGSLWLLTQAGRALRLCSGDTFEPRIKLWYCARNFVDIFEVSSLVVDALLYLSVGCSDEFGAYIFSKSCDRVLNGDCERCTSETQIFWKYNPALRQQPLPELDETQVRAIPNHRRRFGRSPLE